MSFFMDFASSSLNKYGEELCGDKVEFYNDGEIFIAVLSDGLGSGVKANILATLTSKIALTMLKEGLDLKEVIETITKTLPVCAIRKLAYSTFTIIKIDKEKMAYVVEFDNPSIFILTDKRKDTIEWSSEEINGRKIKESKFKIEENDMIVCVSDGVIHAGVGKVLNLGWQWDDVNKYLNKNIYSDMSAKAVTNTLLEACNQLYMQEPGDDTTVATIKVTRPKYGVIFSGPPIDCEIDKEVVNKVMHTYGKKIVCGGTAANIVSRELNKPLKVDFDIIDPEIPPIGYIQGVDLVTEGVLTIKKATQKLKKINTSTKLDFLEGKDGASKLAKMLYNECTHIKMIMGRAINPAHQNPAFPEDLSIKMYVLSELRDILIDLGKIVEVEYC
ncbi:MAG: SpoIIE family protein phosphatase [Peptostreptococcaceae bacterium]